MDTQMSIEELLYEAESASLDFKSEQYKFSNVGDHQKSELLKDILAFSNAWRREDAYILIGVQEVKGGRSLPLGVEEDLDDAQLQQFVNSKTQRPITFTYSTVLIESAKIGVIKIPAQQRPFYLKADYGKLKKNSVYIRRGSSTEEASPDEVRDMGRAEVALHREVPNLVFEFSDEKNRQSLGEVLKINLTYLNIPPIENIPNFEENYSHGLIPSFERCNSDYYRELIKYYFVRKRSHPLSFVLRNNSSQTITDVRVEFLATGELESFYFIRSHHLPKSPRSHYNQLDFIAPPLMDRLSNLNKREIFIDELQSAYRIEIPFEKAQPQQDVFMFDEIYVVANESSEINVEITIYADNIPMPIKKCMKIICEVSEADGSLEAIEEIHALSMRRFIEQQEFIQDF